MHGFHFKRSSFITAAYHIMIKWQRFDLVWWLSVCLTHLKTRCDHSLLWIHINLDMHINRQKNKYWFCRRLVIGYPAIVPQVPLHSVRVSEQSGAQWYQQRLSSVTICCAMASTKIVKCNNLLRNGINKDY